MGDAKRRGTYAERRQKAIDARAEELKRWLAEHPPDAQGRRIIVTSKGKAYMTKEPR